MRLILDDGKEVVLSNKDIHFIVRSLDRLRCSRDDGPRVAELTEMFRSQFRPIGVKV